jgi:hypothetical protein
MLVWTRSTPRFTLDSVVDMARKAPEHDISKSVAISRRDSFLDSLRGIFHIVLLVDHLPILLPGLFVVAGELNEAFGYITVAEGFVFLSGYVSGLVYTRYFREKGSTTVWRKALFRARDIYLCYVLAVILLLIVVRAVGPSQIKWGAWEPLLSESLPVASLKVAIFIQNPTFLEILPMYSLFLILTPALLVLLEKGRWALVLVPSIAVWIAAQFSARDWLLHLLGLSDIVNPGYFNSLAWQILFISGLICGHKTYAAGGPWLPRGWKLPALAYLIVSAMFLTRHGVFGWRFPYQLTERSILGPIRLLNFFAAVFLLSKIRPYVEGWIAWKGFAFLSKNSLQVFAFHLFPIYLAALFIGDRTSLPWWGQLLFIIFCIAGLFLIAFLSTRFREIRQRSGLRRPAASTSPSKLGTE